MNGKARAARRVVGKHVLAGERVDEAALAAPQRTEDRNAPALGPQAAIVGVRIERGLGVRRSYGRRAGVGRLDLRGVAQEAGDRVLDSCEAAVQRFLPCRQARDGVPAVAGFVRANGALDAAGLRVAFGDRGLRQLLRKCAVGLRQGSSDATGKARDLRTQFGEYFRAQIGDQFALHVRVRGRSREA